jgi:1-acyl-sn-glycerol-3-phosphate acyltransferase
MNAQEGARPEVRRRADGVAVSVYAFVELVGTSDQSWERAACVAIESAARSLRDMRVAQVVLLDMVADPDGGLLYRARLKVSFKYEAAGLGGVEARSASAEAGRFRAGWLAGAARVAAGPLYRLLWPIRIDGLEHVPARGPAIIAANHISFFDSVALIMAVRRPLSFVGKAEYLDSWRTRHLLPALGMIPVSRTSARQALGALHLAAGVLARSGLFAIYPEGTRSRDGDLAPGHTGVAHIAVASGALIIPTGIIGTAGIQPPGARVPRPFRAAAIRFGPPIDPSSYGGGRRTRRRRITEDVMTAIQSLSGQQRRPE